MTILGKRIIEVLKADSTLVSMLSDSKSIFAFNAPAEKEKYIAVDTGAGKDEESIPVVGDDISIIVAVKRTVANSFSLCLDIAERVDTLLDKQEGNISDSTYNVINFTRVSGSPIAYDDKMKEYWIELRYKYMITE